jgi:hypothetical protein
VRGCAHVGLERQVKGPAVGVSVTMLGLCDFVLCSHVATFATPPAALGLTPVACASVTLPAIMGPALSSELMLLGRKFTATEARRGKLVGCSLHPLPVGPCARPCVCRCVCGVIRVAVVQSCLRVLGSVFCIACATAVCRCSRAVPLPFRLLH